jgi:hypothetical protein
MTIEIFDLELPHENPESNQKYTTHDYFRYFGSMVNQARKGTIDCEFTWGLEQFNKWLEAIGPIPEGMKKPTVGRYDHSKGYVFDTENNRWNFRWQERSENSREAGLTSGWGAATFEQRSKAGRKAAELGKTGFQTGAAQRASVKSPNHISNRPDCAFRTGAAQKASVASPKNREIFTCPSCGKTGKGPRMRRHVEKLACVTKFCVHLGKKKKTLDP